VLERHKSVYYIALNWCNLHRMPPSNETDNVQPLLFGIEQEAAMRNNGSHIRKEN
jgi:hypothetical protein